MHHVRAQIHLMLLVAVQSVGLLGGLNEKSSAIDCVQLAPLSTSSQRATPDVLRQAAAAAGDPAAGNCSGMPPIGASSASAATRAGQRTPRTSAGRNHHHHYHHQRSGGAHRRAGKSPSGSLGPGYRPNSASSASPCGGGNSSVSAAARRQRGGHRHPVKSDVEVGVAAAAAAVAVGPATIASDAYLHIVNSFDAIGRGGDARLCVFFMHTRGFTTIPGNWPNTCLSSHRQLGIKPN
jgi:hypothetical protein